MLEIEMIDDEAKFIARQFVVYVETMRTHLSLALERSNSQDFFVMHQAILAGQIESIYESHKQGMMDTVRASVLSSQSTLEYADESTSPLLDERTVALQERMVALMQLQRIDALGKLKNIGATMKFGNAMRKSKAAQLAGLDGPITASDKIGRSIQASASVFLTARHVMITLHNDIMTQSGTGNYVLLNSDPDHRHHMTQMTVSEYVERKPELFHHRTNSLLFRDS